VGHRGWRGGIKNRGAVYHARKRTRGRKGLNLGATWGGKIDSHSKKKGNPQITFIDWERKEEKVVKNLKRGRGTTPFVHHTFGRKGGEGKVRLSGGDIFWG